MQIKPAPIKKFSRLNGKKYINNDLNKGTKDLIKIACENYTNITNGINKYHNMYIEMNF